MNALKLLEQKRPVQDARALPSRLPKPGTTIIRTITLRSTKTVGSVKTVAVLATAKLAS
jgi:hypothetical protein